MSFGRVVRMFRTGRARGVLVVAATAILTLTVATPRAYASTSVKRTDFNGDGISDIVGINSFNSILYKWYGNGNGGFDSAVEIGEGWGGYNLVSPGDLNDDGYADLVATALDPLDSSKRCVYEWLSAGGAGFNTRQLTNLGCSSAAFDVAGAGDVNNDGNADLLVFDHHTNCFQPQFGDGNGGFSGGPETCGPSSAIFSFPPVGDGDINGDGQADLIAIDYAGSVGTLLAWYGNGHGGFASAVEIGIGWENLILFGLGDLNGDGRGDLLARTQGGDLYRWYGVGNGTFGTATKIGTGWNPIAPTF